ncbi:MAG: DUF5989 family protein [Candidatus Omnitrophica bacterium]|nr:DUF5989 family protein [Candidatus Omnitrophota bacterium]
MSENDKQRFEEANRERQTGLVREFFQMLMENKKYWMIPLLLVLLVLGGLIILGSTAAAPFIYTLF